MRSQLSLTAKLAKYKVFFYIIYLVSVAMQADLSHVCPESTRKGFLSTRLKKACQEIDVTR